MLSSSQNALIKQSQTTYPKKLLPSDCITLYVTNTCNHAIDTVNIDDPKV